MPEQQKLIREVEHLLGQARKVLDTTLSSSNPNAAPEVKEETFHAFRISSSSWLNRVFGNNHTCSQAFLHEVTHATVARTKRAVGILEAARIELDGDWLSTTKGTLAKDMLINVLRHAQMQRDAGNMRAAVVICGAVIDELLRRVCLRAGITLVNDQVQGKATAKKALQLTGEAYKKKVYDRAVNKQLISWIELFNEQVEGKNDPPKEKQVDQMLKGTRVIITTLQL